MRRHASPHWAGGLGRDHGAGMVADGRIKEERTRLACHRSRTRGEKESRVACGRRSRHEPLRAPGRTRSGDLPLTRRTLYRLSYRGGCRKPPAVRRRPPRARRGPWGRAGRRACRRPVRGARRFRGAGRRGPAFRIPPGPVVPAGSAASRAMEGSNLRLRFWRPSGCRCPNGAFMFSALRFSSLVADRPCGGMRRYASPVAGIPYAGRVCIPAGLYASVCIRGCIHLFFPIRLVSDVPGRPPRVYALYASFPYRGFGKKEGNPIY